MCGRFALTLPHDAAAALFRAMPEAAPAQAAPPPCAPRWNICPTTPVAAVRLDADGARRISSLRWGFLPGWYRSPEDGPLLINARAETIAEKPAFREACRARRCLIPASGFYEWQPPKLSGGRGKVAHWIRPADEAPFAFAGIWQDWRGPAGIAVSTCAIVTAQAGPGMAALHHREPVRIAPESWGLWLGEEGRGAARLMQPAPEGWWRAHPVSPRIGGTAPDDEMLTWEWRPEDGPPPAPEGAQRPLL